MFSGVDFMDIPFNKIDINETDKKHILKSLETGIIDGEGPYTSLVKEFIKMNFNINEFIPTTSGTHALEIAVMLTGISCDDQIVTPSYAFPSSGNSIMLRKGIPVFCDIDEKTLCLDENDALNRITDKTKAIMPIHYGGISCDMDIIQNECQNRNIRVIEDAAQSIGGKYKDKYLGTIGDYGCFSFHSTKNIYCGEGGGLILNVSKEKTSKAHKIIQKGTDRNEFLNGHVDKYTWKEIGSSYVPSDILMSLLYSKLLQMDDSQLRRKKIYELYNDALKDKIGTKGLVSIPFQPEYSKTNHHVFYMLFENEKIRNHIMNKLKELGISAYFHYMPLHLSDMGKKLGYKEGDFPVTERISKCILRLPLFNTMIDKEIYYVIDQVLSLLKEI
jgi:dTDP-4-amino-4,6-dideoxygalactose transaminase